MTTPYRIDVHHHLTPPDYISALGPDVELPPPQRFWSVAKSIEDMDRAGVATAMVSMTTPGLWFGEDAAARRLARGCNEYAARMAADHRGRFGVFAALPLPDIEGSLREIEYALDVLHADGITLFTSYDRRWLGDPLFTPVLAELDRRKAVIHVHPTCMECCLNLIPDVNEATIEYGTDTARTIASLVFSGTASRLPDLRLIFSHAGGTMPALIERFVNRAELPQVAARLPHGLHHELRKFFYDTAQSANPAAMEPLRYVAPVSQILFGTDFPFRTADKHVKGLRECGFTEGELQAIERDNALGLLPRLRSQPKS
jgi:6-methylsalicylate decarboxylase